MATTQAAVVPMKAAQVPKPGADFEIVEREIPKPGAGQVRIKVQACGVCHSDVLHQGRPVARHSVSPRSRTRSGGHRSMNWAPALPSGRRDSASASAGTAATTARVAPAGAEIFAIAENLKIPGISYDGGYQQYMVAPVEALVAIPDGLSDVEAAPLLCAGITTYNALRHSGAMPGDLVAVQGIGGLGHLGIQFANKFGYKVAAIGRGSESAALAKKLGANVYIDSKTTNAAEELQKLGGAQVILATAPSSKAMSELFDGLGPNGKLMVVGVAFDPSRSHRYSSLLEVERIQGWASGTSADEEDTLRFAELTGVRPMIETYPLEKAAEAYARMMSGKAAVPRRADDVTLARRTRPIRHLIPLHTPGRFPGWRGTPAETAGTTLPEVRGCSSSKMSFGCDAQDIQTRRPC